METIISTSSQADLTPLVYTAFVALTLIAGLLLYLARRTRAQAVSASNPHFVQFQRRFFAVYFLALFADWLQGPYVYKLYSYYGYAERQIAIIYVVGFASSVLFGTATGPLADRFGRRRLCLAFSAAYTLCCLTKLSRSYGVLLLGRVFGGVATSVLFTAFESWYVHEHVQTHDFPAGWLAVTFSQTTFWNGVLAIGAGVAANAGAEWFSWGPVAPFMLAIPCLLACAWLVGTQWPENYGDRSAPLVHSCCAGARVIVSDSSVLLLGTVQALFEAVMYVFVFLWTPILDSASPPLGIVFSTFMVCIMIGASAYTLLTSHGARAQHVLVAAVLLHLVAIVGAAGGADRPPLAFAAFVCLEVAVGLYFPAVGFLRSQVVPEQRRAAIMNWFRVPLNVITCGALLWLHSGGDAAHGDNSDSKTMFLCCAVVLAVALLASVEFSRRFVNTTNRSDSLDSQDEQKLVADKSVTV